MQLPRRCLTGGGLVTSSRMAYCHFSKTYPRKPTGGEWRVWYARLCKLIEQYHDRADDAGRFTRRLLREMDSLWVFLAQHGVDPTNNRAEVRSVDQKPGYPLGGLVPRCKGGNARQPEDSFRVSVQFRPPLVRG